MRTFQHRFLASLICAVAFLGCALAQSTLTPIRDTVTNPDGTLFNGTITITWNGGPPPSGTVSPLSVTARVYNGALSLLLVPNSNGTNYQAVYNSSNGAVTWTETWQVPASTTALTLSQIRSTPGSNSGSGSGSGTGSSGNGPTYATLPISISEITGLSSDLDTINASLSNLTSTVNGLNSTVTNLSSTLTSNSNSITSLNGMVNTLNTQVSNLSNTVATLTSTVNTLSNGQSANSAVFVDSETPSGTANGVNANFTLTNTPSPSSSLELYRNGILQMPGVDYTLSGNSITFLSHSLPQTNDILQAFYRLPGSGPSASFVDGEIPSGAINGVNLVFTLANAPNPATSLKLYKNGVLLQQNTDYTLSGSTITFASPNIAPLSGDLLTAFYRH
jgi:prefoldin subunit 5